MTEGLMLLYMDGWEILQTGMPRFGHFFCHGFQRAFQTFFNLNYFKPLTEVTAHFSYFLPKNDCSPTADLA